MSFWIWKSPDTATVEAHFLFIMKFNLNLQQLTIKLVLMNEIYVKTKYTASEKHKSILKLKTV